MPKKKLNQNLAEPNWITAELCIPMRNSGMSLVNSYCNTSLVWSKTRLSWFGCMAAIKMKILPQLFVFLSVIQRIKKSRIWEIEKHPILKHRIVCFLVIDRM